MRPSAKTGMRKEPPRWMVSLIDSISRAISARAALLAPGARSSPRVVSVTRVSKWPAGNFAPGSVRWFSNSTSPVKKMARCLWRISTARRPGHVAGGVKDDSISSLPASKLLRLAERQGRQAPRDAVDLLVGEERVVGDVLVLALAEHDVGRVVQHPLDQHPAGASS